MCIKNRLEFNVTFAKINIINLIFIVFVSILLQTCFGLVPTSFWYVDKDNDNRTEIIKVNNSKTKIVFALPEQTINIDGNSFLTFGIIPYTDDTTNEHEITICFDSLILDTYKKRISARICSWYENDALPTTKSYSVAIKDTCLLFRRNYLLQVKDGNAPNYSLLFLNTNHYCSNAAKIIGSIRIYEEGKLIEHQKIEFILKKKNFKAMLPIK